MRVCFVSHSSRDGGAERVLLETIELLSGEGIDCKVLLPTEGHLSEALKPMGIEFAVISFLLWVSKDSPSFFLRVKTALSLLQPRVLLLGRSSVGGVKLSLAIRLRYA